MDPMSRIKDFHPTIKRWFTDRFDAPTPAQAAGWPEIRRGGHALIAAPTGSGKTLAAFLTAIDGLARQGADLADEISVVYISPLKALGNDVQRNLELPLSEMKELDESFPDIRVFARSGDTTPSKRAAMKRRPPQILVTTPESLYILLGSESGAAMLSKVKTVIVDEIHALFGDKRGSHLALSLERLEDLSGPFQRVGLSATQKPIAAVGEFLVGSGRECRCIDIGHQRELDLEIVLPDSELTAVCSHEVWAEIYDKMAAMIEARRSTLVFTNTRKLAERIAARLAARMGEDAVGCHHSSLSKDIRLRAEERLKAGKLRALVATASLELGIDVGEIDLVIQTGTPRKIATLIQRVGRSGHGVGKLPVGRIFPLTRDELVEAAALVQALEQGELDRIRPPEGPLDILAQQLVAAVVTRSWDEDELFARVRRAHPYRDLPREDFDAVVALHDRGRRALIHRDGVGNRLLATRRARLVAISSGGAIPDRADYRVVLEPDGTTVGSLDEDFAVESSVGDVFQLGGASWQVVKVEPGVVRVADAHGAPPSLPFWFGEAPGRSAELSRALGDLRESFEDDGSSVAGEIGRYLAEAKESLGVLPSTRRVVLERFFDETGGSQIVLHAPFGSRVNRAWGLALRKRFCRRFGFELQAAANDDAVLISLAPQSGFPLEEVFDYLHPDTVREVLIQALLPTPLFTTRWRWNVTRSLVVERSRNGKRVPAPLLRFRANDALAEAFPDVVACPENLESLHLDVPRDHPVVRQTIEDCLQEAMDLEGLVEVLKDLRSGRIERHAVDLTRPSVLAQGVMTVRPYGFLDDAPLEERRIQAVRSRRILEPEEQDGPGALDPEAVRRVREEAWPDPRDAEDLHHALGWMGFLEDDEVGRWRDWIDELAVAGRAVLESGRWYATEATREPEAVLRGRLEALGPVFDDDPSLALLERKGQVMRTRIDGREAWCDRRLLARIHRYTIDRLRSEIEPVSARDFWRFLTTWQHVAPGHRLEGPEGLRRICGQLGAFEAPAAAWEKSILPARIDGYRRAWLDELTLTGELGWGRLWGSGASPLRSTPVTVIPRGDLETWMPLVESVDLEPLHSSARLIQAALAERGALFPEELASICRLLPPQLEEGLAELVARGLASSDSWAGLRQLLKPPSRRRHGLRATGRWGVLRRETTTDADHEKIARRLLERYGVLFRRVMTRERQPLPWRELVRALRRLELRSEIRGGRFVAGFEGEQFALPDALSMLRRPGQWQVDETLSVVAADPLNLQGILTPEERLSPQRGHLIEIS